MTSCTDDTADRDVGGSPATEYLFGVDELQSVAKSAIAIHVVAQSRRDCEGVLHACIEIVWDQVMLSN